MCPMKHWGADDLDEIIQYGDINFRKQLRRLQNKCVIKPSDIRLKVYTSRAKIFTKIGVKMVKGVFDYPYLKDLVDNIEKMLSEYDCAILTYCNQSYAIWKEEKAFYLFNSEDTDEAGNLTQKTRGACCVIRFPGSLTKLGEYLSGILRISKKPYEIYSFKIREQVTIEQELSKLNPKSFMNVEDFCSEMSEKSIKKKCGEIPITPAILKNLQNPFQTFKTAHKKKIKRPKAKKCWQIAQLQSTDNDTAITVKDFTSTCEELKIENNCEINK